MHSDADTQPRDLEELLGPADERFFGAGYRGVAHELLGVPQEDDEGRISQAARIRYPRDWSVDPGGASRQPHLSTIDAVVLPLMALSSADPTTTGARIAQIELRAGAEPWTDLSDVPVRFERDAGLLNCDGVGHSLVHATTGNIRSKISILRGSVPDAGRSHIVTAGDVYSGLYQKTAARSTLVDYSPEEGRIAAEHTFTSRSIEPAGAVGVEGAFWPALTVVDYLVTMGQLAQALIQLRHGNGRTGLLWMRKVTIRVASTPEPLPTDMKSVMTISRDHGIELRGMRFRNITVQARTSTNVGVTAHLAKEEPV